jgi:hypothetical protein
LITRFEKRDWRPETGILSINNAEKAISEQLTAPIRSKPVVPR